MNMSSEIQTEDFLESFDYKKQAMYRLLPEAKKETIRSLPSIKHKKRMTALMSYEERGTTPRQKWISGLHHMREMTKDAGYFLGLIFRLDREAVDDIVDIFLNFESGEYDSEKNTDPAVYSLLVEGVRRFKARRYHEMDYDGLLDYFEKNPERNPLNKENKNTITAKKEDVRTENVLKNGIKNNMDVLKVMGKNLKIRRMGKRLTQAELAGLCQVSERTVKKIEAGEPSSTQVLLRIFDFFDLSQKVFDVISVPERDIDDGMMIKKRVRHKKMKA